jgi:hypothetical protein
MPDKGSQLRCSFRLKFFPERFTLAFFAPRALRSRATTSILQGAPEKECYDNE